MENTTSRFDVRDYQRILARRWWFILTICVCTGIIGVFIVLGLPKTFRAMATVVVPEAPKGILLLGGEREQSQDIALETQALIAQGNQTALRTAKALAERTTGSPIIVDPSEITDALRTSVKLPDLLTIEATSEDKEKAKEFANQTALSFLEVMDELRQKQNTTARDYLDSQVEITRNELETLITKRQDFQRTWGLHAQAGAQPLPGDSPHGGAASGGPVATTVEPDLRPAMRVAQTDLAAARGHLRALQQQQTALTTAQPMRARLFRPAGAAQHRPSRAHPTARALHRRLPGGAGDAAPRRGRPGGDRAHALGHHRPDRARPQPAQ